MVVGELPLVGVPVVPVPEVPEAEEVLLASQPLSTSTPKMQIIPMSFTTASSLIFRRQRIEQGACLIFSNFYVLIHVRNPRSLRSHTRKHPDNCWVFASRNR